MRWEESACAAGSGSGIGFSVSVPVEPNVTIEVMSEGPKGEKGEKGEPYVMSESEKLTMKTDILTEIGDYAVPAIPADELDRILH